MAKYISIEIPTKKYIKVFLIHQYGEKPIMNGRSVIGSKFYDLLSRQTIQDSEEMMPNKQYNELIKLYVARSTFFHRGAFINCKNLKDFNLFLELHIKDMFRFYMDFYVELLPSFEANLQRVREKLGLDVEAWNDDSMKKVYYRYRLRAGKPLFYKK